MILWHLDLYNSVIQKEKGHLKYCIYKYTQANFYQAWIYACRNLFGAASTVCLELAFYITIPGQSYQLLLQLSIWISVP